MADTVCEKKETVAVAEKEAIEKPVSKEIDADEDSNSKTSENGDAKLKENGDKAEEDEESKDGENGDSSDAHEACPVKRKSGGGDAPDAPTEGASPEKKAKLDEKSTEAVEANGADAKAAA